MQSEQFASTVPRKVALRLIPLLIVTYVMAHLDRINVSFASLTMNVELGFSNTVYGFGAGLFFVGYLLFEIPSNMLLERIGARRLIATIMIVWGSISACTGFIATAQQFYVLRFILGVAESGLYPGIILYITYWFREQDRAAAIGQFAIALAIAGLVGGPLSGWILDGMDQVWGLSGWRWLFIVEGLPTVALALVVLAVMTDRPRDASWLSVEERAWLTSQINVGPAQPTGGGARLSPSLDPTVWLLAIAYLFYLGAFAGIMLWAPKLVQFHHPELSNSAIGWLVGLPYIPFAVALVYWGRRSDRSGERFWHVASAALVGAFGLACLVFSSSVWALMASFVILMIGMGGGFSAYWAMVTELLGPRRAAIGIALVNSAGALGSFLTVDMVGRVTQATHSYTAGMGVLAASTLAAVFLVQVIRVREPARQIRAD